MTRCHSCQRNTPTDAAGICASCHGGNIGHICDLCGQEWATEVEKDVAKCETCLEKFCDEKEK